MYSDATRRDTKTPPSATQPPPHTIIIQLNCACYKNLDTSILTSLLFYTFLFLQRDRHFSPVFIFYKFKKKEKNQTK